MEPSTSASLSGLVSTLTAVTEPELRGLAFGWAKAMPSVVLIPAFGLRAVPTPVRGALALCLALVVAPALAVAHEARPLLVGLVESVATGLPVAVAASAALWTATMVGGLADELRGAREASLLPVVEPGASPLGAGLSLLASGAFLASGGAARVAAALASARRPGLGALTRLVTELAAATEIAVVVAAPLVATALIVEVASALIAREASPANVSALLTPLRSLGVLAVLALSLERMVALLGVLTQLR